MVLRHNLAIAEAIREGDLKGLSASELKNLYIGFRTIGLAIDEPVHRVFQLEHAVDDISAGVLTHVRLLPATWGDAQENPLLQKTFTDDFTGQPVSMASLVDDFYALCWTTNQHESREEWQSFSHNKPAVRLSSTPRLLLERLMHEADPFFMLRHTVGRVTYESSVEIAEWIANADWIELLDSQGQNLATSAMILQDCFESEDEVRLLYSLLKNDSSDWVRNYVHVTDRFCLLPFAWKGAINGAVLGPGVSGTEAAWFSDALARCGMQCRPTRSVIT